jgi:WD40 repeat protein
MTSCRSWSGCSVTDTGQWHNYSRSQAVLIGAWNYDHLPKVPAVGNSLERMAGLLTSTLCAWPPDRVKVLRGPRRRENLPDELMELFDKVTEIALFYFVGHGQMHGDQLCLALEESPDQGPRRATIGLPFTDVRAALDECDAKTKIVILDCCYSGHETRPGHTLAPESMDVIDQIRGTGAFMMTASGRYQTAWYESDAETPQPQTYFTKYLIDTIEQGLPGHPTGLPLGPLFDQTAAALVRDGRPAPTRTVRHAADGFLLARNPTPHIITPAPLPQSIRDGVENRDPDVRIGAINGLSRWLSESDPARALTARTELQYIADNDIPRVAGVARTHLDTQPRPESERVPTYPPQGEPGSLARVGSHTLPGQTSPVHAVAYSPDGTILATAGHPWTVSLWDPRTRQPLCEPLTDHTGPAYAVVFSPDGTILASGSQDKSVRLWDPQTRQSLGRPLTGHTGPVHAVVFSPDGTILATGSQDKSVRLWDLHTRQPLGEPLADRTSPVHAMAFSPDGTTLATGNDHGVVRLWDPQTRQPLGEPLTKQISRVRAIAFSPSGTILATGNDHGLVRLWDPQNRKPIGGPLSSHVGPVHAMAFSPDGTVLATAGNDKSVRLWDLETRQPLGEPLTDHIGPVHAVAFSPNGIVLAAASDCRKARSKHPGSSSVRLWEVGRSEPR